MPVFILGMRTDFQLGYVNCKYSVLSLGEKKVTELLFQRAPATSHQWWWSQLFSDILQTKHFNTGTYNQQITD